MEFKKAMKTWERMCRSYDSCKKCPFLQLCGNSVLDDCLVALGWWADKVEPILEKWAAEHPEPDENNPVLRDFLKKVE